MSRVSNFRERQRQKDLVTVEVKLPKEVVRLLGILSNGTDVSRVEILSRELGFLSSPEFKQYVLCVCYDADKKDDTFHFRSNLSGKSFISSFGF